MMCFFINLLNDHVKANIPKDDEDASASLELHVSAAPNVHHRVEVEGSSDRFES